MAELEFLGTGMKFPPQVSAGMGRFEMSAGAQSVKESVYLILMTQRGERWLQPEFGSQLMSYTFMDTSLTMLSMMKNDLRSVLLEQEPRISQVNVEIEDSLKNSCLIVHVQYAVAQTNTTENLVFPFYLNATQEEEDTDEAAE